MLLYVFISPLILSSSCSLILLTSHFFVRNDQSTSGVVLEFVCMIFKNESLYTNFSILSSRPSWVAVV